MAAVDLRGSLTATLLGGPSLLTGGSSPVAASCLKRQEAPRPVGPRGST